MEEPRLFNYLGHLGLAQSGGGVGGLDETLLSLPSAVSLQDVDFGGWLSGNLGVMGFLEEDLSRFSPY